jgi:hypothetical protein
LNLFANAQSCSAFTDLNGKNFPVFSRETGNYEVETGSPMTASTANFLRNRLAERIANALQIVSQPMFWRLPLADMKKGAGAIAPAEKTCGCVRGHEG